MGAVQPTTTAVTPPSPHHNPLVSSISSGSLAGTFKNESIIIDAISETNPDKSLHIFDTGYQNTAVLPNYQRVRLYFLGLAGVTISPFSFCILADSYQITELRDGYNMLLAMHKRHHDKTWNAAISLQWVDSLKLVLTASVSIVNLVELGESILIQHKYAYSFEIGGFSS